MRTAHERPLAELIRRARVERALTRWETAVTIALTILATPAAMLLARAASLPSLAWVAVLGFGIVAITTAVAASLTDPESQLRSAREAIERRLPIATLDDEAVRETVGRALQYRVRTEKALLDAEGAPRATIRRTTAQIDGWLIRIHRLGMRLEILREEHGFQFEEQRTLRARVAELEAQIVEAVEPRLGQQIRQTLAAQRHQLRAIEELRVLMERGTLQLEHAVGALGTVYTQLALLVARDPEGSDAPTVVVEIEQEMQEVDAVLSALDRIYERAPEA